MSYAAPVPAMLPPVYLHTHSRASVGRFVQSTPSSTAWTTTNRIVYVPFSLSHSVTIYKYFWLNGATVGTNNFQLGTYTSSFVQIHEGTSTLSAGANVCQYDNITDYTLGPGRYYMALWGSGTTATIFMSASTGFTAAGHYYETNAGGLPATGTPANPGGAGSATLPMFGLVLRSSP